MSDREVLKALQTIPNIGKACAQDLLELGVRTPEDLKGKDPKELFDRLCQLKNDPQCLCMLDTLMSAVHYADTGERKKWWEFGPERKERYGK